MQQLGGFTRKHSGIYATRKGPFASSGQRSSCIFTKAPAMKTKKSHKTPALLLALIITALFLLPSCEKADPVQKEPKKVVLNKKAAEILQADRQFAFELFREVKSLSDEENLNGSPPHLLCPGHDLQRGQPGPPWRPSTRCSTSRISAIRR